MNKGNVLVGALAGIAAGAILGLLIAPDKGAKTRKKIAKKGTDSIEDLREAFNNVLDAANKKYENAKSDVRSKKSKIAF